MVRSDSPHRRWNPLRREWVLVSPHRAQRPWHGAMEVPPQERFPEYDSSCYLCPRNVRNTGAVNPDYSGVFAFTNDFPALIENAAPERVSDVLGGITKRSEVSGTSRVLCFSPRHDRTLPELPHEAIRAVIHAWQEETERLKQNPDLRYPMIFENKGAAMGCSNPHPHCQIWATSYLPDLPAAELAAQVEYKLSHGSAMLLDYAERELAAGERIVCANKSWTALVPYWAVWPFEAMIIPRREVGEISELSEPEKADWACIVKELTIRYDNLFSVSFPYSMGLFQRPFKHSDSGGFVMHQKFFPPLLRSATVKKFMVGFELCAEAQRDITPEMAAARLREVSAVHYRTGSL